MLPPCSSYTQEVADKICQRLMAGESLRKICQDEDMPGQATVYEWLTQESGFSEQYTKAREAQAETMADELLEIADDDTSDVNRARLRIDTRKWVAMKLKPKKYGDKLAVGGDDDMPPIKIEDANPLEVARRLAFLLRSGMEAQDAATSKE